MLTAEARALLARNGQASGGTRHVIARKGVKVYMQNPNSRGSTVHYTASKQKLYLGEEGRPGTLGKKVLIVDDVISTEKSCRR